MFQQSHPQKSMNDKGVAACRYFHHIPLFLQPYRKNWSRKNNLENIKNFEWNELKKVFGERKYDPPYRQVTRLSHIQFFILPKGRKQSHQK